MRGSKGFTLVELAVVLVVVALLFGGLIKGQEVVRQARVKKLEQMVGEMRTAAGVYYRSQGRLPGDDNNDGKIAAAGDTKSFFEELAELKLVTGDPAATTRNSPFGGDISVSYDTDDNYIEVTDTPDYAASVIDDKQDDGDAATGAVRYAGGVLSILL